METTPEFPNLIFQLLAQRSERNSLGEGRKIRFHHVLDTFELWKALEGAWSCPTGKTSLSWLPDCPGERLEDKFPIEAQSFST